MSNNKVERDILLKGILNNPLDREYVRKQNEKCAKEAEEILKQCKDFADVTNDQELKDSLNSPVTDLSLTEKKYLEHLYNNFLKYKN